MIKISKCSLCGAPATQVCVLCKDAICDEHGELNAHGECESCAEIISRPTFRFGGVPCHK